LQENNTIKVESNVAVVTEEDSIGIKPDEVYVHPAFCVKIAEPGVSLFLDKVWHVFEFSFFLSFYFFISSLVQFVCNTTFSSGNVRNALNADRLSGNCILKV
jgi:hypothetical protein